MTIEVPLWLIWIVLHVITAIVLVVFLPKHKEPILGTFMISGIVIVLAFLFYNLDASEKKYFEDSVKSLPQQWQIVFESANNMRKNNLSCIELETYITKTIHEQPNLPKLNIEQYNFMKKYLPTDALVSVFRDYTDYADYTKSK